MSFQNSQLSSTFFSHLDESVILKHLEKEEISGSRFLSFRKKSGGIDYCIKIPRLPLRKSLIDGSRSYKMAETLNFIGRDSYSLLPPMWARADENYGIILIMPWGKSVSTPESVSGTLEYLRRKYQIELYDVIQCHSWQGKTFISDWSDVCFPK